MTVDSVLILAAGLSLAVGSAPATSPPDTLEGPGGDVPYVAQGPLLCGGAAVAMVARHWGDRGVHAADFAPLVREEAGGIRASELVQAAADLGFDAQVVRRDPARVLAGVRAGLPAVVLLEDGDPDRLHYVTLVGVADDSAAFHDPNHGPSRRVSRASLRERWGPTGFWGLVMVPPADQTERGSDTVVEADGSRRHAAVQRALGALRDQRPAEALQILREAPAGVRSRSVALRMRATAHYLTGNLAGALAAWNRLDEPHLDLVVLEGLRHTRHPVVLKHLDLIPGELLTPALFDRSRRRLEQLPSVASIRLDVDPVPNGDAELRAAILEHRRWPDPALTALKAGVGAFAGSLTVEVGPLFGLSDRWHASGQWGDGVWNATVRARLPAPPLPGIAEVGLGWRREHHLDADPAEAMAGWLGSRSWVAGSLRAGARIGIERWQERGRTLSVGAGLLWAPEGASAARRSDGLRLRIQGRGWAGEGRPFAQARLGVRGGVPSALAGLVHVEAGASFVTRGAPPLTWPGAGVGEVRRPLLRAHPLIVDGRLSGPAFGRRLAHLTVEHRWVHGFGPLQGGVFAFADGAWAAARGPGRRGSAALGAVGLGVLAASDEVLGRGNLAWGNDGWVFSVVVRPVDPW